MNDPLYNSSDPYGLMQIFQGNAVPRYQVVPDNLLVQNFQAKNKRPVPLNAGISVTPKNNLLGKAPNPVEMMAAKQTLVNKAAPPTVPPALLQPKYAAMGALGASLLNSRAPSTDPRNASLAGALGLGGQAAMQAYGQAQSQQMQRGLYDMQIAKGQREAAAAEVAAKDAEYLRKWYAANPTERMGMKLPVSIQQEKMKNMLDPSKRYKEVGDVLYDLIGATPKPIGGQDLKHGVRVFSPEQAKDLLGINYDPTQTYMRKKDGTIGVISGVKDRNELEKTFRDEMKPFLTSADTVIESMNKINAGLDRRTGAGDLAAINSYQRMIDPAVVRGEDVELIRGATGIWDQIQQWKAKAKEGELLPDTLRAEMKVMSAALAESTMKVVTPRLSDVKYRVGITHGARLDNVISPDMWNRYENWRSLLPTIPPKVIKKPQKNPRPLIDQDGGEWE